MFSHYKRVGFAQKKALAEQQYQEQRRQDFRSNEEGRHVGGGPGASQKRPEKLSDASKKSTRPPPWFANTGDFAMHPDTEDEDVELEKSNMLLLGPTGKQSCTS